MTDAPLELTPALIRRRDRIRLCLAHYYRQPEDSKYRSPWGIMHAMLPYGVDAQVKVGNRHVNAIGWLCWNGKGQNLTLLEVKNGSLQPRSGPGMQGHDAQFLFMLAQCRVPLDYPIKVDGYRLHGRGPCGIRERCLRVGNRVEFQTGGTVPLPRLRCHLAKPAGGTLGHSSAHQRRADSTNHRRLLWRYASADGFQLCRPETGTPRRADGRAVAAGEEVRRRLP